MVQRLPLREEEPPDDTVVVIRAGLMTRDRAEHSARQAHRRFGIYALSVEAVLDGSVEGACRESPRIGRLYGKVRLSSVGRLRAVGFALIPTFERPHYSVVLPDPGDATMQRVEACFDPPIPNPARASRGGG